MYDEYVLCGDDTESYYLLPFDDRPEYDLIYNPRYWKRINELRQYVELEPFKIIWEKEGYECVKKLLFSDIVVNTRFMDFLSALARETGRLIRDEWKSSGSEIKDDGTPVTLADQKASAFIIKQLRDKYRNKYPVLCEEAPDDPSRLGSDYCFVVDPIDGTKGFISGNGEYTVNIALVCKGEPIVGVVYAPESDDMFMAAKGVGAFRVKQGRDRERIRCTERTMRLRMSRSRNHPDPREDELAKRHGITEFIQCGSSIKGCLVAAGEADVYYRFGETSEWDTAAMQCIVEQAGGIFRQLDGSAMTYNREDTRNHKGFCAVNWEENLWIENEAVAQENDAGTPSRNDG
jgi:3'(2'), 5'-bisphosphate nucleotidase